MPTKRLQVLGAGCPKCKKLAENAEAAAKALGIEYTIEKVNQLGGISLAASDSNGTIIDEAGIDAAKLRAFITGLQDQHAEKLKTCDPHLQKILDLERREGMQVPGFVVAGAPMGA